MNTIEDRFITDHQGAFSPEEAARMTNEIGIRVVRPAFETPTAKDKDAFPSEPPEGTATSHEAWKVACRIAQACNGTAPNVDDVTKIIETERFSKSFENISALTRALIAVKGFVLDRQESISEAVKIVVMLPVQR